MWSPEQSKADIPADVDLEAYPPPRGPRADAVLGAFSDTRDMYAVELDGSWVWDTGREEFHRGIVSSALASFSAPQGRAPIAIFSAGGPASGKSSVLNVYASDIAEEAVRVDPDALKAELPEYLEMLEASDPYAAYAAHEESSYLAKRVFVDAIERGLDIVIDGTGSSASFLPRLIQTAAAGYEVRVVLVDVPTEVAVERAVIRAFGSYRSGITGDGRLVPLHLLRLTHRDVARMHVKWRNSECISEWTVYSNDVDRDTPARVVATRSVQDADGYLALVAKTGAT